MGAEQCTICLQSLLVDGAFVIRLPCSHAFHYGPAPGAPVAGQCAGVRGWLAAGGTCPGCRVPAHATINKLIYDRVPRLVVLYDSRVPRDLPAGAGGTLRAEDQSAEDQSTELCTICCSPVAGGEAAASVIRLPCSHVFHYEPAPGAHQCVGVRGWLVARGTCPNCRARCCEPQVAGSEQDTNSRIASAYSAHEADTSATHAPSARDADASATPEENALSKNLLNKKGVMSLFILIIAVASLLYLVIDAVVKRA